MNDTDRFTPEAIKSAIEQLRTKDGITVTEIKDEGDAVRVLGNARIKSPIKNNAIVNSISVQFLSGEVYGTLLYLKKAQ